MSRLSAPHPQISFSATLFTSLARSMTLFDVFLFSPNSSDKLSSCQTPSQRSLIHNWKIAANALYKKTVRKYNRKMKFKKYLFFVILIVLFLVVVVTFSAEAGFNFRDRDKVKKRIVFRPKILKTAPRSKRGTAPNKPLHHPEGSSNLIYFPIVFVKMAFLHFYLFWIFSRHICTEKNCKLQ